MNVLIRKMTCFFCLLLPVMAAVSCGRSSSDTDVINTTKEHTTTSSANVTIDGAIEYQTIDGWGIAHYIEWNWEGPDRYPIPEREVISQIEDLGITFVHVYHNNLYEDKNDNNDPWHYNWDSYNIQFGKHKRAFQRLTYIQNAGMQFAMMGGYGKPAWMTDSKGDFDSSIPQVYDEFGEYWSAFCKYAKNKYALDVPYIVIQNEPSYDVSPNFLPSELRDAIKAVGARLRQEGFNTMILAPEDASAEVTEKMCQSILTDPVAKSYISRITFHGYDGTSQVNGPDAAIPAMKRLADNKTVKNSGLPLWLTEWALFYDKRMRDYVDSLRLALDFAKMVYNAHVYANASNFVIWTSTYDWGYDKDGNGIMENEGIFGPSVAEGKLNLKKYGHAFSHYAKYVPPGSKRIDAVLSGASNVFVTAYKDVNKSLLSIVFINKNTSTVPLTVNIKNLPNLTDLRVIRTSATENSVKFDPISLTDNTFSTILLDSCVTTFTGHFSTN